MQIYRLHIAVHGSSAASKYPSILCIEFTQIELPGATAFYTNSPVMKILFSNVMQCALTTGKMSPGDVHYGGGCLSLYPEVQLCVQSKTIPGYIIVVLAGECSVFH